MFDNSGKLLIGLLGFILTVPIVLLVLLGHPGTPKLSLVEQLKSLEGYTKQGKDNAALIRLENTDKLARFTVLLDRISSAEKLRLDYNHVRNVATVAIEIPKCRTCKGTIRHENRIIDHQKGNFYFGLNDTDADFITVVLHGHSRTLPIEIGISSFEIIDKNFIDSNLFFVILMLGVSGSLILIGSICGALLRALFRETTTGSEGVFLVLGVFAFSILMVPALFFLQSFFPQHFEIYLLILALIFLISIVLVLNRSDTSISKFLNPIGNVIVFYLVASIVIAGLLGFTDGIALQEYFWSMVGKFRLFYGHKGHDNAFQYLNGLAIADNKPFSYFYDTQPLVGRLFYGVEDRQMMTGPIFAVYRVIWGVFSPYAIHTYAFYTIFGTSLTLLIFFPIHAFFSRFFDQKIIILSLIILTLTTYVLGELYYTWFKILGGALVLSGVFFLYLQPSRFSSWLLAGIFWGLAANIHAGQVIVYPLLLLFFYLRQVELEQPITLLRYTTFAIVLTGTVIATLLPWEIVKSHYYPSDLELFRAHFLRGERYTGDIVSTVGNFLNRYTLEEQVAQRLQQLNAALRLEEVKTLLMAPQAVGIQNTLIEWNRLQYRYIAIMVYPLLLMLLLAWLAARFTKNSFTGRSGIVAQTKGAQTIFYLAVGCVLWGLLVSFTKYQIDFSGFVSPFSLIFINMFLITFIAAFSRFGLFLITAYGVLGIYKLVLYYRNIINFEFVL